MGRPRKATTTLPEAAPPLSAAAGYTRRWALADLLPVEYNPRKIRPAKAQTLRESIERYGQVQPLVVNIHPERRGRIVGGEQRYHQLQELGISETECVEVNLGPAEERDLNLRLNQGGEWDWSVMAEHFEVEQLEMAGFEAWELRSLPAPPPQLQNASAEPDALPQPNGGGAPVLPPMSTVRMAQLFFSQAAFERFTAEVEVLQARFGTETLTDTVERAVHLLATVEGSLPAPEDGAPAGDAAGSVS